MTQAIALDVETHLIKPGNTAPRVVCLSWATKDVHALDVDPSKIETDLRLFLGSAILGDVLLVGHVVAFDFSCILRTFPDLWDLVWEAYEKDAITDTAIREKLLDIAEDQFKFHMDTDGDSKKHGYDLADICFRRLHRKLDKGSDTWRLRYSELEGKPLDEWPRDAIEYAVNDSISTLDLFRNQEERARKIGYPLPTQFEDSRADFALRLVSIRGICTDRDRVERLWRTAEDRMEDLALNLYDAGLVRLPKPRTGDLFGKEEKPSEVKKDLTAIRKAVEEHLPDPPRTPKGAVRTDKETLLACRFKPFDYLVEFNSLQKASSTYLSKLFDSPIHASFYAIGAASGRTSCSGPNLQNQPRMPGVRECFVPRPGFVFLACDFSAQEMRTLAQSCLDLLGFSRLAERFAEDPDFDPHLEFAQMMARGDRSADLKALRQRAKAANFGFPAGMGVEKFVIYARDYGLDLSLEEGGTLRTHWFEQWPEMEKYFNFVSSVVGPESYGTSVVPQSGFTRAGCGFSDCANSYFQTLANHASKSALWEVSRRAYCDRDSWIYGSRPVLYIHDEIVLETPEEVGAEAAAEVAETMVRAMNKWTPGVPAKAEAVLMRRWSKKAKPTFDDSGRLIPWEE